MTAAKTGPRNDPKYRNIENKPKKDKPKIGRKQNRHKKTDPKSINTENKPKKHMPNKNKHITNDYSSKRRVIPNRNCAATLVNLNRETGR